MRGGDHQLRAARLICREWEIPKTYENMQQIMGTFICAQLSVQLAWRDLRHALFEHHPVFIAAEWLANRAGRTFK